MINLYGRSYEDYRDRTGMFVPKWFERYFAFTPESSLRYVIVPISIIIVVIGTGFVLREVTLYSLPFETRDNLTLVPILPEDRALSERPIVRASRRITGMPKRASRGTRTTWDTSCPSITSCRG